MTSESLDKDRGRRVGFIGLGRMGGPMCLNLLRAGHAVTVHDRRREAAASVVAEGAQWASSLREVAADVDVVITVLPGVADVEDVMLGPAGVLEALRGGTTWIDMTTGSPPAFRVMADRARARGIFALDAPVGGGPVAAAAGTLQVFVGGDSDVVESWRGLLAVVGDPDRIVHAGPVGTGCTSKLLVNLLWFGQALANGEALMLAKRSGIDLETFRRAVTAGSAASHFANEDAVALLAGNYLPVFSFARCCDELTAVGDLAGRFGLEMPLAETVADVYQRALERYGDVDGELLAVKYLEDTNDIVLRHPAIQAHDDLDAGP